jgi:hypothetical protein
MIAPRDFFVPKAKTRPEGSRLLSGFATCRSTSRAFRRMTRRSDVGITLSA